MSYSISVKHHLTVSGTDEEMCEKQTDAGSKLCFLTTVFLFIGFVLQNWNFYETFLLHIC